MNSQPTSSSTTLEDVLQDPNTDWSQIREAIKVSSGTALTNVGCVVGALNHAAAAGCSGGGAQIEQVIDAAGSNIKAANDDDNDGVDTSFTSAAKETTVIEEKNAQISQSANTIAQVEATNTPSNNFEEDSLQRINEENDVIGEQRPTIIMSNTKKQQQSQQGQQTKRGSHSSRRNSSRRGSIERTSSRRGSIESVAESSIAAESILSSAASGISNGDNSSIDIMDFGISQRQLSVVSSGRSNDLDGGDGGGGGDNESGREESGMLSELCDSKGFLHWDPHLHQRQQQRNGSGSKNGSFRNNTPGGGGVKGGVSGSGDGGDASVEKARRFKLSEGLSNRTIVIDGRYNMNSERSLYSECSVEVGGGDVNVEEDDNVEEEEEVNMTAESSSGVTTFSSMDDVRQRRGGALDANNRQESIRTLDSSSVGVPSSTSSDVQRGHYNKFDSTRALLQGTNNDADSVDVQSTQSSSAQSTANRTASTSTSTSKRCEDRRAIYTGDESTRTFESNYSVDSKGFMPWSNKSRQRRGLNREESTRTYDSWAQSTAGGESSRTVDDSVDSMKGGGGGEGGNFMHWDQTKKMSNLSLMFDSSNSINVEEEAEEEREEGNVKMDASACPAELGEILGQLKDERRRSSSSNTDDRAGADFTPAQLKYEPAKNNKLSVLQRMSSKLSSSLTSASTRTPRGSWNLATSLPSDQLDTTRRTYQRQHMGSIAWSLTSSDRDGTAEGMISNQDIKLSILNARSSEFLQDPDKITSSKLLSNRNSSWTIFGGGANNNRGNGTDVATLSSSYSGCGEVPIRISREDNVNIEELRRDILSGAAAGDNCERDGGGEAKRKSSFSLFATSLDDEL